MESQNTPATISRYRPEEMARLKPQERPEASKLFYLSAARDYRDKSLNPEETPSIKEMYAKLARRYDLLSNAQKSTPIAASPELKKALLDQDARGASLKGTEPDRHMQYGKELFGFNPEDQPLLETKTEEELIGEKLQPKTVEDNKKFKRVIFNFKGQEFSFRGRNELPVYKELSSSHVQILGERPSWISEKDFEEYIVKIQSTQRGTNDHYLTTKTVLGVIELSQKLGSANPQLQKMAREIAMGVYSKKTLYLVDALLAANYIDENSSFRTKSNPSGEALVILALSGDKDASIVLKKKMMILEQKQQKIDKEKAEGFASYDKDGVMRPENIVCVHTTRYKPEQTEEGYEIKTTFDATNENGEGVLPRNSIHVSLNHKVGGGFNSGSWDGMGYAIVAPFTKVAAKNGVPFSLWGIDTWWTKNPGERLLFTDGLLVKMGEKNMASLYEKKGKEMLFKMPDDVGLEDLKKIRTYVDENKLSNLSNLFKKIFDGNLIGLVTDMDSPIRNGDPDIMKQNDEVKILYNSLKDYYQNDFIMRRNNPLFDAVFKEGYTKANLSDICKDMLGKVGVDSIVTRDYFENVSKIFQNKVEARLADILQEVAICEAIKECGGEVNFGPYTQDNSEQQLNNLRKQYQAAGGLHAATVQGKATDEIVKENIAFALTPDSFMWEKYGQDFERHFSTLDEKTARMIYAGGFLTARA